MEGYIDSFFSLGFLTCDSQYNCVLYTRRWTASLYIHGHTDKCIRFYCEIQVQIIYFSTIFIFLVSLLRLRQLNIIKLLSEWYDQTRVKFRQWNWIILKTKKIDATVSLCAPDSGQLLCIFTYTDMCICVKNLSTLL